MSGSCQAWDWVGLILLFLAVSPLLAIFVPAMHALIEQLTRPPVPPRSRRRKGGRR